MTLTNTIERPDENLGKAIESHVNATFHLFQKPSLSKIPKLLGIYITDEN